jgi:large subunit ribosomal protein L9
MDVILLEKVDNLGDLGDKVTVKPGYARNYLVPSGKAQMATPENVAAFEQRRAELEREAAERLSEAEVRREAFESLEAVEIKVNVGAEGKLFGSVGPADIVDALEALGIEAERKEVRMPEGPIREAGEHTVEMHLHADINVELTVRVVPEEAVAG